VRAGCRGTKRLAPLAPGAARQTTLFLSVCAPQGPLARLLCVCLSVRPRGRSPDYFSSYSAAGRRNATASVYVSRLPAAGEGGCPAAFLVGVDATPEPGLRMPTNFCGCATAELMRRVDEALAGIRAESRWKLREARPDRQGKTRLTAVGWPPVRGVI
jgi:hypothetical protein